MDICEECGCNFDMDEEGGYVDGLPFCDWCYEDALEEAA